MRTASFSLHHAPHIIFQLHVQCDGIQEEDNTTAGGKVHHQQLPVSMVSPYRVRLRAKTPSQFPTDLSSLDGKLDGVEGRLELVRRGRSLFKLMRDKETEKVACVLFMCRVMMVTVHRCLMNDVLLS